MQADSKVDQLRQFSFSSLQKQKREGGCEEEATPSIFEFVLTRSQTAHRGGVGGVAGLEVAAAIFKTR